MRRMALAALLLVAPAAAHAETLHIKIVLTDAGETTAVPGHALLISDNPATSAPRLVRTRVDGTADVTLRPGNYTIESDAPVSFHGKAYQWTQTIDVRAGRDATLTLTAANADAATTSAPSGRPLEADPAFLLPRWEASVVRLWTPTKRASAFVIDSRGLVATSQRAIGAATSVEVQITPAVKVAARVLASDVQRDVAVLWVDAAAVAAIKPIPLGCRPPLPALPALPAPPALSATQEIFAIGVPLNQLKDITQGTPSELKLSQATDGGPIFTADGTFVGITSVKVVEQADVCEVVASAEKKMGGAPPPAAAHLPIEPDTQIPEKTLKEAASRRVGNLAPYQVTSPSFEIAFITPVMVAGTTRGRLFEFGNWTDYVSELRPVLLVRVSPKLVESVWAKVARGAAYTQGAVLPAITHPKSALSRLRAYCGDNEVTPIHPFTVELRVADREIAEALYVFDAGAFGPQCTSVKLVLYAEKEPEKGETIVVPPPVVQRIRDDFAPYR